MYVNLYCSVFEGPSVDVLHLCVHVARVCAQVCVHRISSPSCSCCP